MDGNGNAGWSLVERIADESSTIMHCQMKMMMREEKKSVRIDFFLRKSLSFIL
jgi:hypothetical protein